MKLKKLLYDQISQNTFGGNSYWVINKNKRLNLIIITSL